MKQVTGIFLILLAAMIGIVEFRLLSDPIAARDFAIKFAEHDPFPRLPWDMHVIFILLFIGFLVAGISLMVKGKAI
jgi:hypothetical protein